MYSPLLFFFFGLSSGHSLLVGWELECCCSAGGVEDLLVRFVRLSCAGNDRYWERKWLFSHTYVRALSTNVLHFSTYVQSKRRQTTVTVERYRAGVTLLYR